MREFEIIIGLEIHAELKTKSKMFCSCKNDPFHSEPNTNICPVCLGMPGVLPVLNRQAIDWTIMTGLALNCKISSTTKWDRKNYFYPDLPKGYQISQYDLPICYQGYLQVGDRKIRITRIHLEEDTGTLKHPEGRVEVDYSLANYNRAGVPLMELVTEPDIRTAEEAKRFCQDYQQLLRALKIADADMEKGQLRAEVNISLRPTINQKPKTKNQKLGTKVEIKNLNSFKAVGKAIKYEIERQIDILESGGKIVQETRGWDDRQEKTYAMRTKETSADYRYFPEPDLLPVVISKKEIEKIKKEIPELPKDKKTRFIKEYEDFDEQLAEAITNNAIWTSEFEKRVKYTKYPRDLGTFIVNEPDFLDTPPETSGVLIDYWHEGKISKENAKGIFPDLRKGKIPAEIIKEKGLKQISDLGSLQKIIDQIIAENPDVVESIKKGKPQAIGFLVGQVMKKTKGQANPQVVSKSLEEKIEEGK